MAETLTPARVVRRPLALPEVRLEHLWLLAALVAPFMATAGTAVFTIDTWWALLMGRLTVEAGAPVVDVLLTHTPAQPGALNGQWLGQYLLYALYAATGEVGLRAIAGLALSGLFALLYTFARAGGATPRLAVLALLSATLLAVSNLNLRAQLFTYPLFALTWLILARRAERPRRLLLLPPILALWANLHGSFPIALTLIGCYLAADLLEALRSPAAGPTARWRAPIRLALALGGGLAATLLTPLGPDLYRYLLVIASNPAVRLMQEWQPTSVREPTGFVFVLSVVALIVALRRSRRPLSTVEPILLLVFGGLAASSLRQVVWWAFVVGPILAWHISAAPWPSLLRSSRSADPDSAPAHPLVNLLFALLLLASAALAPAWRPLFGWQLAAATAPTEYAPVGAAEALARLPAGRLFHDQRWTGYLLWRLWPHQRTFLDVRAEASPPAVVEDFLALGRARADWETILDRYQVDYRLLQPVDQRRLAELAEASGRWARLYEDETTLLLGRR